MILPSKRFLDKIVWQEGMPRYEVKIFVNGSDDVRLDGAICGSTCGIIEAVRFYYKLQGIERMNTQRIGEVHLEAARNGFAYGNALQNGLACMVLYGTKGICQSFWDGGDFFRQETHKRIFEVKEPIKEFSPVPEQARVIAGGRTGVDLIYRSSDDIEVDTTTGTLHCLQYLESLRS
jgi:hypothetical protein